VSVIGISREFREAKSPRHDGLVPFGVQAKPPDLFRMLHVSAMPLVDKCLDKEFNRLGVSMTNIGLEVKGVHFVKA
jgi:hypothetical protein